MKILIHDYAGHPFQVQLSRELAERGHKILHTYAGGLQTPRGELTKKESDHENFESFEVPMNPNYAKNKYSFPKRRVMEIEYGRAAGKMIQNWRPDVVVSANTPTESQTGLLNASQAINAKFVYWCQDFYSIAVDKLVRKKIPVFGQFIGRYYRKLDRKHLQASDHVIAITEDFVPIMVKEFGVDENKTTTIPNWAPLDSLPIKKKENSWSTEQGLADKFVFLYTGTLGMKHNPKLLLELAKKFKDQPEVEVVVVSEGLGADWLRVEKDKAELSNLTLLGYQPFELLPEVLASGDVLIGVLEEDAGIFSVPSKVLTYLCAGKAILLAVPAVNLAAKIIEQEKAGLTVAPSDEQGFLAGGEKLLSDKESSNAMAKRAREYAERTFDINGIGERFESLLKGL